MDVLSSLQVKAEMYDDAADLNEVHQRWKSQNTNLKGIIGYYSYTKRFYVTFNPLNAEFKTHLPSGGIIRSSPYFPCKQVKSLLPPSGTQLYVICVKTSFFFLPCTFMYDLPYIHWCFRLASYRCYFALWPFEHIFFYKVWYASVMGAAAIQPPHSITIVDLSVKSTQDIAPLQQKRAFDLSLSSEYNLVTRLG